MSRAWKWVLGLVGISAASVGILAFDTYQRALRAIEAEEARLRDDIAAYRARWPAARSPGLALEAGHADTRFPDPLRRSRGWLALRILEGAERDSFECGYARYEWRRVQDTATLSELRDALTDPELRRADLQRVSLTLQQILARRTTVADLIEAESLRDRAELLKNLRNGSGDEFLTSAPGWKELFSWRILVVKALRQLEERKKELTTLKSDSLADWESSARDFGLRIRHEPAYTRSTLCSYAAGQLQAERQSLLHWKFSQVATRIALFSAENHRVPADLEELGLEIPDSPYDGEPFEYRDGVLRTARRSVGPQLEWTSPRR